MIPTIEHSGLLILVYWLLMIPIAVLVLIRTTAFWTGDGPGTVVGAVKTVLVMWLTVFLVYDLSGYVFARLMQDPRMGMVFPPHYTYLTWLREPMGLKWYVLGYVPMIRYLPVLFALCAGGVVQVLLWKIPFRVGMIVFLCQLFIDIFAMAVLSLLFSFFIGVEKGVDGKAPRAAARKGVQAQPAEGLPALRARMEKLGADEGPMLRRAWGKWQALNDRLAPAYDLLDPITRHLPLPVRDFLVGGGWLFVIPVCLALLRLRSGSRRAA